MRTTIIFCLITILTGIFILAGHDVSELLHNEAASSILVPFFIFVFFLMDISEAFFGTRSFHKNLTHFTQDAKSGTV